MRLRFSSRTDYALRAALELALAGDQRTAVEIAHATGAPPGVVAQALARLAHGGVVHAVVGRAGGYTLARPADEIRLLDIVESVEHVRTPTRCVLHQRACSHEGACPLHHTIVAAQEAFWATLARETLADVAARAVPGRLVDTA